MSKLTGTRNTPFHCKSQIVTRCRTPCHTEAISKKKHTLLMGNSNAHSSMKNICTTRTQEYQNEWLSFTEDSSHEKPLYFITAVTQSLSIVCKEIWQQINSSVVLCSSTSR